MFQPYPPNSKDFKIKLIFQPYHHISQDFIMKKCIQTILSTQVRKSLSLYSNHIHLHNSKTDFKANVTFFIFQSSGYRL